MSILNHRGRRQRARHIVEPGGNMAEKTAEKAEPEVRKFSKAQMKRFNELQANAQRAQGALQEFVNYLGEEHGLEEGEQWTLGPQGFVRADTSDPPADA